MDASPRVSSQQFAESMKQEFEVFAKQVASARIDGFLVGTENVPARSL